MGTVNFLGRTWCPMKLPLTIMPRLREKYLSHASDSILEHSWLDKEQLTLVKTTINKVPSTFLLF